MSIISEAKTRTVILWLIDGPSPQTDGDLVGFNGRSQCNAATTSAMWGDSEVLAGEIQSTKDLTQVLGEFDGFAHSRYRTQR